MSRNHRRRTLGFERLETRRLLAGDVNYSVANNTLTLTGDNAANAILTAVGPTRITQECSASCATQAASRLRRTASGEAFNAALGLGAA
jgi:hypothetical protein